MSLIYPLARHIRIKITRRKCQSLVKKIWGDTNSHSSHLESLKLAKMRQ